MRQNYARTSKNMHEKTRKRLAETELERTSLREKRRLTTKAHNEYVKKYNRLRRAAEQSGKPIKLKRIIYPSQEKT